MSNVYGCVGYCLVELNQFHLETNCFFGIQYTPPLKVEGILKNSNK